MAIRKLEIGKGMDDQALAVGVASLLKSVAVPFKLTVSNQSAKVKLVLPEISNDIIQPGAGVTVPVRDSSLVARVAADIAQLAAIRDVEKLAMLELDAPNLDTTSSEESAP